MRDLYIAAAYVIVILVCLGGLWIALTRAGRTIDRIIDEEVKHDDDES